MSTPRRCAFYLRVSTPKRSKSGNHELPKHEQSVDNQRPDLVRLAELHDLAIVREYATHESTSKRRATFDAMMADARRRQFDALLVWAIDRFGRSLEGNVRDVLELERLGIRVMSFAEPWLDTNQKSPVRGLLLSIFSWIAEQERLRRSERTKAGLARVRSHGSKSGRPIGRPRRLDETTLARERGLAASGQSSRQIAVALKLPRRTVRRALEGQAGQNGVASEPPETVAGSTPAAPVGH